MSYPEKLTAHLRTLMNDNESGIFSKMFLHDHKENIIKSCELTDPLGGDAYAVSDSSVHHYKDRLLILVTDNCAAHCRYCFRRNTTGRGQGPLSEKEIGNIVSYLKQHSEIREVLLSGGDPFTLLNTQLKNVLSNLRRARPDVVIRIGSRMPVVSPERFFDKELLSLLKEYNTGWIMTHINHIKELSPDTKKALKLLKNSGLALANQTVLLKGVNDNVKDLTDLFSALTQIGIKPYYLFQGDLAQGISHFRVPLSRALKLVHNLRRELSGLSMPVFAVDIPGGGGKIPLQAPYLGELTTRGWHLTHPDGSEGYYPEEVDE